MTGWRGVSSSGKPNSLTQLQPCCDCASFEQNGKRRAKQMSLKYLLDENVDPNYKIQLLQRNSDG
jgi:hypothetical protein